MKKIFSIIALLAAFNAPAQVFIDKGMIEYEVRTNNHKTFGEGIWAEAARNNFPKFSTTYYQLTFSGGKSIYKFNRYDQASKMATWYGNEEDNVWYNDYESGLFVDQKNIFNDTYLLSDSLTHIQWKLDPTESREIAGFQCRKATGILFDSVYVFAFYTDEIVCSGGPMGITGLPGMIMGITIPRMFTSWIATKVEVNGIKDNIIVAPQKGKKKKAADIQENVVKVTKDWGSWGQQAVWKLFL